VVSLAERRRCVTYRKNEYEISEPGSPWQNAHNESFNLIFRTTCLDRCLLGSMTEARVIIDHWLNEYNRVTPHGSLGGMTPKKFLQRWTQANIDQRPKSLAG
jgi:transposase InsO family protein